MIENMSLECKQYMYIPTLKQSMNQQNFYTTHDVVFFFSSIEAQTQDEN